MTLRRLVVAAVCLGLFSLAAPALAHADLESSTPAAGSTVEGPVRRVVLRFSAPVDPPDGGVEVLGASGEPVPTTMSVNGAVVRLRADEPLTDGAYGVRYAVTAADAHTTGKSFTFRIRPPPTGGATPGTGTADRGDRGDTTDRAGPTPTPTRHSSRRHSPPPSPTIPATGSGSCTSDCARPSPHWP